MLWHNSQCKRYNKNKYVWLMLVLKAKVKGWQRIRSTHLRQKPAKTRVQGVRLQLIKNHKRHSVNKSMLYSHKYKLASNKILKRYVVIFFCPFFFTYPPARSPLSYFSYQLGRVKRTCDTWSQPTGASQIGANAASQSSVTYLNKNMLSTLFCIHGITDDHDWLTSAWLTGEIEDAIPPTQRTQPILLLWTTSHGSL